MTKQHTHCGTCSQCIDRRFAVLAGGLAAHDPAEAYKVDLLIGERTDGDPKTMLAAYLETANEMNAMSAVEFFSRYGEATRVVRQIEGGADVAAMRIFDLSKRHAKQVTDVLDQAIQTNAAAIRKRELPPNCLLRLVCESGGVSGRESRSEPPEPPSNGRPRSYICRKNRVWAIRFDGQDEQLYLPDIGFSYLQLLLHHPGTKFSAAKLDCTVRRQLKELAMQVATLRDLPENGAAITEGLDGDDVVDDEGCENLRTRLAEIEALLPALRESAFATRLDEIDELEKERKWIMETLRTAHGLGGRKRQLADERNRVRNRVGNAIRRALKQIKQFDTRLAEHLVRPVLNLGHTISYVPRQDTSWSLATKNPQSEMPMLHEK